VIDLAGSARIVYDYRKGKRIPGRSLMRSFVAAVIAAVVIAVFSAVVLNAVQKPAEVAYATSGARI
jgi:hypothetical protein